MSVRKGNQKMEIFVLEWKKKVGEKERGEKRRREWREWEGLYSPTAEGERAFMPFSALLLSFHCFNSCSLRTLL